MGECEMQPKKKMSLMYALSKDVLK